MKKISKRAELTGARMPLPGPNSLVLGRLYKGVLDWDLGEEVLWDVARGGGPHAEHRAVCRGRIELQVVDLCSSSSSGRGFKGWVTA